MRDSAHLVIRRTGATPDTGEGDSTGPDTDDTDEDSTDGGGVGGDDTDGGADGDDADGGGSGFGVGAALAALGGLLLLGRRHTDRTEER